MEDDRPGDSNTCADTVLYVEGEGVRSIPKDLHNGYVILTLSTRTGCWGPRFEYSSCVEMLSLRGMQVPPEDLELPLAKALDTPEVRRYLLVNSILFLSCLAPVLYLVIWCSLFATFHLLQTPFSQMYFAAFCLTLSGAAVLVTGTIIFVLYRYRSKISVNTEIRLTRVNEMLRSHHLLVGLYDQTKNCSSHFHLSFCYFDVRECLKRLTHLLEGKQESSRALLVRVKRKFGGLCVVVSQGTSPLLREQMEEEDMDSEETPLLQAEKNVEPRRTPKAPGCSLPCSLTPRGVPQEVASQLVALHSALYVKLLATHGLPRTGFSLHAKEAGVPCICQFIETTLGTICSL